MSFGKLVEVGDRMVVFDAAMWHRRGGDEGDNSIFWKLATIININVPPTRKWDLAPTGVERIRAENERRRMTTAKVQWLDGSLSQGHFVQAMRYCDSAENPRVAL